MVKVKSKNKINKIASFILFFSLIIMYAVPTYAETQEETKKEGTDEKSVEEKEDGTIYISTAEDFIEFAEKCSMDTWSCGKNIVLKEDISLENTEFLPVPTFAGTFDGGGHTISGLNVTDSVIPAGLFGTIQSGAVVKNLNVCGNVSPSGDAQTVGGIVGENNGTLENCTYTGSVSGKKNTGGFVGINGVSGRIMNCSISGVIYGESMTGGIAGYNLGEISSCTNSAGINTESVDPSLSLEDIDFSFMTDLSKLSTLDTNMAATDTGGITGYSSGILLKCVNNGTVGYQHIGYNVGGIAGRSCGYISECTNSADVYGRKDVGGIAGQVEPFIDMNLTEDTLSKLQRQMDELSTMIDSTLDDTNSSVGTITSRLNSMADYLDAAAAACSNIQTYGSINSTVVGSAQANSSGSVNVDPPQAEIGGSIESGSEAGVEVTPPSGEASGSTSIEGETYAGLTSGSAEGEQSGSAGGTVNASTQITLNTSLYQLSAAVNGMSGQMRLLNGEVAGSSGTLTEDMKKINTQINEISDTLFNATFGVDGDTTGDILTDTSDANIEAVTFGKIYTGNNSGHVNGDINTGGIAGTMAIEYELDPEDDLSSDAPGKNRREFELKAILQKCVNSGKVVSKRNYAGSVCGRMDLGLIKDCEGYGDTESENGDYVGGIAGLASGSIRNSYAKCTLKGKRYIGGIVGSGVTEDISGSSSIVTGCYAVVHISDYNQYAGGISGVNAGEFSGNYYIAEGLAAINRLSYAGKAEPVTYEDLVKIEGLPSEFQHLTLKFVADDETIETITFDYGDSPGKDVYPEIPQKEGYYAQWDTKELENLCFDTVVTANYSAYHTSLESSQQREDGRSIFFVEGEFEDGNNIIVTKEEEEKEEFGLFSENLETALEKYFSFLQNKKWPENSINWKIIEQWKLIIPDDGTDIHSVRYLAPEEKTDHLTVYVKQNGNWKKAESEYVGSYLTFSVPGETAEVAIILSIAIWWAWLIFFVLVFLIILSISRLIRIIRKRRKSKKAQKEAAQIREIKTSAAFVSTGEDKHDEILRRVEKAEADLAKAKAELLALHKMEENTVVDTGEESVTDIIEEKKEDSVKAENPKKKKRRLIPVIIVLVLLGCAVAGAVVFLNSDFKEGLEACRLLQDYTEKTELAMELNVQANIENETIDTTAQITRSESDGKRITCIGQSGINLYYSDEIVYLDNGKAFPVNDLFPDYSVLLDKAEELYQSITVSETDYADGKIYSITAEGENARSLLQILIPTAAEELTDAQVVRIELKESNQELKDIHFIANGTLNNSTKTEIGVDAVLTMKEFDSKSVKIPKEVKNAINKGNRSNNDTELSENLFLLLTAWSELESREVMASELTLTAEGGPLVVNDEFQLFRSDENGEKINCIRKNGKSIYFTEEAICDQNGKPLKKDDEPLVESSELLEIAYQLFLNGDFNCTELDGRYIYTLKLDEDGMKEIANAIAPETEKLDINYESTLQSSDEKATNPYLFRTVHEGNHHVSQGKPTSEVLFELQSHEIKRIAAQENCIFVGRCADYVLRDEPVSILNVFVSAPFDQRVKRKSELEKFSTNKAKQLVTKMDKQRKKYYENYTDKTWGEPESYDLYINTGETGIEKAVELIVERYKQL